MARRAAPVRTCLGCRCRAARADLLRVVAVGAVLVPDLHKRLPGRGAHLHPDLTCLDLAERRRAFPRALRTPGPLDAGRVRAAIEAAVEQWDVLGHRAAGQGSTSGRESPESPARGID